MVEAPIDASASGLVTGAGIGSSSGDKISPSEHRSDLSENDLPALPALDAVSLQGYLSSRVRLNSQSDYSGSPIGSESGEELDNEANSSDRGTAFLEFESYQQTPTILHMQDPTHRLH